MKLNKKERNKFMFLEIDYWEEEIKASENNNQEETILDAIENLWMDESWSKK